MEEYIRRFLSMDRENRQLFTGIIESKMFDMGYTKPMFFVDNMGLVTLKGSFYFTENEFGNEQKEMGKGNLQIDPKHYYELPVYFKKVTGFFIVDKVPLKSLKGCPERIGGDFAIMNTEIESLEGCPKSVTGEVVVRENKNLSAIDFFPIHVGNGISVFGNKITCYPDMIKKFVNSQTFLNTDPVET